MLIPIMDLEGKAKVRQLVAVVKGDDLLVPVGTADDPKFGKQSAAHAKRWHGADDFSI